MSAYLINPIMQRGTAAGTSLVLNSVFVPANTDLLMVGVVANFGSSQSPTGATFGAQSMTQRHRITGGGTQVIWYYLHRPVAGTAAVTVTFNLSTNGAIHAAIIAGTRTPLNSGSAGAGGAASSASVTLSGNLIPSSDLFLTMIGIPTGSPTITPTNGQVPQNGSVGTDISNGSFGVARPFTTTGIVSSSFVDSYTFSPSTPYNMLSVHLKHYGVEDGEVVVVR